MSIIHPTLPRFTAPLCAKTMGTLYLVRHGQASFGAADYDQLSTLGARQCECLGQWFKAHGVRFDAVFTGTLKRHAQSLTAIEAGLGQTHEVQARPELNEYDSHALIRSVHDGVLPTVSNAAEARVHFQLLRQGLTRWMQGQTSPEGMPRFAAFVAGIDATLAQVRERHTRDKVLIVSSGGPISMAIGHLLGMPPEAVIELNLHLRNSAVCELRMTTRRFNLVTFNTLPHLNEPRHSTWITHA
jgi:broad specificity phosphatase PhoE